MRRIGSLPRLASALVAASLIAVACGGGDDSDGSASSTGSASLTGSASSTLGGGDAPPATAAAPAGECTEDRVGGEITFGNVGEPSSLDPTVTNGGGSTGGSEIVAIYDSLVRYDQETDTFVPLVAESLVPNADFTEWTLKLREGVTFGNGDPLTADIVKTSFARHQDPDSKSVNRLESQAVTEMEVVDPLTLVFHLDGPWSRFPALLANVAGMITNPAVVAAQGEAFGTDPTGGGVGPFELERWTPGEELVLRAKTDWWGGPVCIEQLRFIQIPGAQATLDSLQNGDIQVASLREIPVIAQAEADGINGVPVVDNAGLIMIFNHERGPTQDLLVRQALAAAIDPAVIQERAWNGGGAPSTALIDAASPLYDGLEGPQPDAARAAELVEQAKAAGWDGNLEMPCQSTPSNQDVCLAIKAMVDAAGMNLTIRSMPTNEFVPLLQIDRNFELGPTGMPLPDADPWLRLSASLQTGAARNYGGYSNPDMDAALDDLHAATDDAARKAALAAIQEIWNETLPNLVYGASINYVIPDESVNGILFNSLGLVHFDEAYIEE